MRFALVLVSGLAAANCAGASPTAPTPVAAAQPPFPAPVSQTMTGTWSGGGQRFTVTQIGDTLVGALVPDTQEMPGPITVVETATITGAVTGEAVTMLRDEHLTIVGTGSTVSCSGGLTFTGTLSGNTLSGTITAGPAPLDCGGAVLPVALASICGPIVYTRQ